MTTSRRTLVSSASASSSSSSRAQSSAEERRSLLPKTPQVHQVQITDEETPLSSGAESRTTLPYGTDSAGGGNASSSSALDVQDEEDDTRQKYRQSRIFKFCVLIAILLRAARSLLEAPLVQLKETAICQIHYGPGVELGRDCTSNVVQDDLTDVVRWQQVLDCVPVILLGLAYGVFADRYGRARGLALNIFSVVIGVIWLQMILGWPQVFPVRLTWISSVFYLLGGGPLLSNYLIYIIISDVMPAEKRATKFYHIMAIILFVEMVFSPLTSLLVHQIPWTLVHLGFLLLLTALIVTIMALPETLEQRRTGWDDSKGTPRLVEVSDDDEEETNEEVDDPVIGPAPRVRTIRHVANIVVTRVREARIAIVSQDLILLVPTFFVVPLYSLLGEFLSQCVSRRFGWRVSNASFLLTYRALVHLAVLLMVLPGLDAILLRKARMDARKKDLLLSRGMIVTMTVGAWVIFLAPLGSIMELGLTIFTVGQGFLPVALSLATSFVTPRRTGVLYTSIAASETLGILANVPILSKSFDAGVKAGGLLAGLPFMVAAIMLTASCGSMFAVGRRGLTSPAPLSATILEDDNEEERGD